MTVKDEGTDTESRNHDAAAQRAATWALGSRDRFGKQLITFPDRLRNI